MRKRLLDEFESSSREDWKAQIIEELKGKTYENLLWENEGLRGEPVYTRDNLADINTEGWQNKAQSIDPIIYGNRHWINYQQINVTGEKQANEEALEALNLGADGLLFSVSSIPDFEQLLKSIKLEYCAVSFELLEDIPGFMEAYYNYLTSKNHDLEKVNGFMVSNRELMSDELSFVKQLKQFKTLNIALPYGFKSVNVVQELAILLREATTKITSSLERGFSIEEAFSSLQFELRLGSNYFIEIAKVRAMRSLAVALMKGFGYDTTAEKISLLSSSGKWEEPVEDAYNYLLKATTSAMSAVIGGSNALLIRPFYNTFQKQPKLAVRNARNISSILKDESYLDKVVDAAAGSYFIESITDQLIDRSWKLFLELEKISPAEKLTLENLDSITLKENS